MIITEDEEIQVFMVVCQKSKVKTSKRLKVKTQNTQNYKLHMYIGMSVDLHFAPKNETVQQ